MQFVSSLEYVMIMIRKPDAFLFNDSTVEFLQYCINYLIKIKVSDLQFITLFRAL